MTLWPRWAPRRHACGACGERFQTYEEAAGCASGHFAGVDAEGLFVALTNRRTFIRQAVAARCPVWFVRSMAFAALEDRRRADRP